MHNERDLNELRHSAAHLLGHAVTELYPHTQLTIGPATAEGFFYDFLPETNFKESDLPAIADKMLEIANRNLPITHEQMPKDEARKLYAHNKFKLELIDGIPGDTVGIARQGDFYDLCKGGHVATTGLIKNFRLQNVSGSYWRANREDQALQRISGTAFFTAQELQDYETRREHALLYDHRRLGKQLDLFSFHEEGAGFPFFHPKGKAVCNAMTDYLRVLLKKNNYKEIATPIMLSDDLWKRSGHYAHYKKNMFFSEVEDMTYAVRPMNCPGSILVYKERPRSYRELPLRLAEFGLVHRFELSGVLHGLFRARSFTQDDGHIYCTQAQIESEVATTMGLIYTVLKKCGFEKINICVSTRPENSMGSAEVWEHATDALKNALNAHKIPFTVLEGEGAFYGPKIEVHIEDSMQRSWQCGTVQVDFFQPENFDLSYIASSGEKERPVMIHRALYGSFERFFGIMLEHHKGNLPFWLAPVQIKVLTITDDQKEYAMNIVNRLNDLNFRVEFDESSDPISGKIKTAQLEKTPWMLVIGKKEVEQNTITLRHRDGKQEFGMTFEQIVAKADELIKDAAA